MTNAEAVSLLMNISAYDIDNKRGMQKQEALEMAIKALEQARPKGKWIVHPKGIYAHLVCSKCLSNAPYDCKTNYCPNCGAKMEVEE